MQKGWIGLIGKLGLTQAIFRNNYIPLPLPLHMFNFKKPEL